MCAGELDTPQASGVGSNATAATKQVPEIVIFGGRTFDDQFAELSTAITARAPGLRIVRIEPTDELAPAGIHCPGPGPTQPGMEHPDHEGATRVLKAKLARILSP